MKLQIVGKTTFDKLEIGDAFFLPTFQPTQAYPEPPIFIKVIMRKVAALDGAKREINSERMNENHQRFFGDGEDVVKVRTTTKPESVK